MLETNYLNRIVTVCTISLNIIMVFKSMKMRRVEHTACMAQIQNAYTCSVGILEETRPVWRYWLITNGPSSCKVQIRGQDSSV